MEIIVDAEKAIKLVSEHKKDFHIVNSYCPNPWAYECDRRTRIVYESLANHTELYLMAGDILCIDDGGKAWVVK